MTRSIRLERRLTHDAALRLWDEIAAQKGEPYTFDCSEVRHLSASAFQVLLIAARMGRRDGQAVGFRVPSEAFAEGLHLLGGEELLGGGMA